MAFLDQRQHLADGHRGACGHLIQCLAAAVAHRHLRAARQRLHTFAVHSGRQRFRSVAPQIPGPPQQLRHGAAGASLGAAVIPLRDIRQHVMRAIPGQRRGLPRPPQGAGEHASLGESIGERLPQPHPGLNRLMLAGGGERDIRSSGVLSGNAPCGLPMPQQHQATGLGGIVAANNRVSHTSYCTRTPTFTRQSTSGQILSGDSRRRPRL